MTIGALALAGVFGFAGYFAKDSILAIASEEGRMPSTGSACSPRSCPPCTSAG